MIILTLDKMIPAFHIIKNTFFINFQHRKSAKLFDIRNI